MGTISILILEGIFILYVCGGHACVFVCGIVCAQVHVCVYR